MKKKIVSIYSLIHFVVDLACAILVTNLVTQKMGQGANLFVAVVIYNFFAFAMQLPIGVIADRVNKNALLSAIGCLIVAIAFAFSNLGIIACLVAGIGNSLFHVGGGIDVLNISDKKAALSGIFVSTGAMGIFLGTKSSSIGFNKYYIVILSLIFAAIVLFILYNQIKEKVKNEEMIIPELTSRKMTAIICLIFTVVVRSYVGFILAFDWKSSFALALTATFAVVFGKMLGGIIGDKIGLKKISLISLGISAILFIFAFNNWICGTLAILLFNMTMPITLSSLSNLLPKNKGMAFGLLTFALFIGAIPVFCGYDEVLFNPVGLFITVIISAIVLYIGIIQYLKIMEKGHD